MEAGKMNVGSGKATTLIDDLRNLDNVGGSDLFDLGHPLLNRIAHTFVKAAGVGALQAISREGYFVGVEAGAGMNSGRLPSSDPVSSPSKRARFPVLTGETNKGSIEALVKSTGKESLQWGLAAGMYSGLTYGLKEARGTHDWKNSAVAGAITGAALSMMTTDNTTHEQVVQCAITGAAISTVANFMKGIF